MKTVSNLSKRNREGEARARIRGREKVELGLVIELRVAHDECLAFLLPSVLIPWPWVCKIRSCKETMRESTP